jgi:hypothetical protein
MSKPEKIEDSMALAVSLAVKDLEDLGKRSWVDDQPTGSRQVMIEYIREAIKLSNPTCSFRMLEIGTSVGVSSAGLITVVCNETKSEPSVHIAGVLDEKEMFCLQENNKKSGLSSMIFGNGRVSHMELPSLVTNGLHFNFVHLIDCHGSFATFSDIVLGWHLLLPGGIMVVDNFMENLGYDLVGVSPYDAVTLFLSIFENSIEHAALGHKVYVQKKGTQFPATLGSATTTLPLESGEVLL